MLELESPVLVSGPFFIVPPSIFCFAGGGSLPGEPASPGFLQPVSGPSTTAHMAVTATASANRRNQPTPLMIDPTPFCVGYSRTQLSLQV